MIWHRKVRQMENTRVRDRGCKWEVKVWCMLVLEHMRVCMMEQVRVRMRVLERGCRREQVRGCRRELERGCRRGLERDCRKVLGRGGRRELVIGNMQWSGYIPSSLKARGSDKGWDLRNLHFHSC